MPYIDKEQKRQHNKEYRLKNRERIKVKMKIWTKQNREYVKTYRSKKYTGIYGSWYAMKQRCNNPNNKAYHNYGGRGIIYDSRWESFENFKNDMGSLYKKGLTVERVNNNGNYTQDNCRWATKKEQSNNMRKNIFIKYKGRKKTLAQWAEHLNLKYHTLLFRYLRGWNTVRMLSPLLERPAKLTN